MTFHPHTSLISDKLKAYDDDKKMDQFPEFFMTESHDLSWGQIDAEKLKERRKK